MGASDHGGFGMTEKAKQLTYFRQLILWAVSDEPLTASGICEKAEISRSPVNLNLRKLREMGLIYVSGEAKTSGRKAPMYSAHKKHEKPSKHFGGRDGKSSPTRQAVCDALFDQTMTMRDIVTFTGLTMSQVHGCIAHWRSAMGSRVFRICRWQYESGQGVGYLPVWALGPGPDAPKPEVDRRERDQRWRERNRMLIRARSVLERAKAKGVQVEVNPFSQLLSVTGSTFVAAKHKAKVRAEETEGA